MSNYPHIPWWVTPPWEETENTMTYLTEDKKEEVAQDIQNLIYELDFALQELEDDNIDACFEELQTQSGTIQSIIEGTNHE
jgi:hypothetical protein